jgi:hypothetical protein
LLASTSRIVRQQREESSLGLDRKDSIHSFAAHRAGLEASRIRRMTNTTKECTWEGCEATGFFDQKGKDGRVWACLCETHDRQLDAVMKSGNVKRILGTWVKAQGGASAAAARM